MIGKMTIKFESAEVANKSPIERGPLKLPEGAEMNGQLIAIGENDIYLHCVISGTGDYYGVFKSDDENHLYQHLLRLNSPTSN